MYFYCIIIVNLPHSFKLYEKNPHVFHGQVESECNKDWLIDWLIGLVRRLSEIVCVLLLRALIPL